MLLDSGSTALCPPLSCVHSTLPRLHQGSASTCQFRITLNTMDRNANLLDSDVMRVLIQHSSFLKHKQELFCSLLCTSKAMDAALAAVCAGHINVVAFLDSKHDVLSFAAWLGKHGLLVNSLSLCMWHIHATDKDLTEAGDAVALAVMRAAESTPAGLQLQRFSCPHLFPALSPMLWQLPSSRMTSLHVRCYAGKTMDSTTGVGLSQLTNLRSLTIGRRSCERENGRMIDPLLQYLSGMTRLVQLDVDVGSWVHNTAQLQHLPQQLQRLSFSTREPSHKGDDTDNDIRVPGSHALNLKHLTGLTQLTVADSSLTAKDELPSSLQQLTVLAVNSAIPLVQLRQLTQLRINSSVGTTQDGLQQLSRLQQLQSLEVVYELMVDNSDAVESGMCSARAWPQAPLTAMSIYGCATPRLGADNPTLTNMVVQQLSCLSRLTSLCLHRVEVVGPQLCASLGQLTALQSVGPSAVDMRGGERSPNRCDDTSMMLLMRTLKELPCLSDLRLAHTKHGRGHGVLARATNLTSLALEHCQVARYALDTILCGVTGLSNLRVAYCTDVHDSVVPQISTLQHLTSLFIAATNISEVGAQLLLGLKKLDYFFAADNICGINSDYEWSCGYLFIRKSA